MANSLHSVVDQIKEKTLGVVSWDDVDPDQSVVDVIDRAAARMLSAICFDIGDVDYLSGMKPIRELVKLPFKTCWFEAHSSKDGQVMRTGCLCIDDGVCEGEFECLTFVKWPGKDWAFIGRGSSQGFHDRSGQVYVQSQTEREGLFVGAIITVCAIFISALNCNNVIKIEHPPEKKLQKARAKKNKTPLFSYWMLNLSIPSTSADGAPLGGTHASPRVHLRRGHPREYSPGKYCWVQPAVVGDPKRGMVHKDYQAKYVDKEPDH